MIKILREFVMENSGFLESFDFVVIHNDAGRMKPKRYISFLRNRDKALGIAHFYCNRDTIVQVVPIENIGSIPEIGGVTAVLLDMKCVRVYQPAMKNFYRMRMLLY